MAPPHRNCSAASILEAAAAVCHWQEDLNTGKAKCIDNHQSLSSFALFEPFVPEKTLFLLNAR